MSYRVTIEVKCDICEAEINRETYERQPGMVLPEYGRSLGYYGAGVMCEACEDLALEFLRRRKANLAEKKALEALAG